MGGYAGAYAPYAAHVPFGSSSGLDPITQGLDPVTQGHVAYYGKRSADAEPEADADAQVVAPAAAYGLGYAGAYGAGYGYPYTTAAYGYAGYPFRAGYAGYGYAAAGMSWQPAGRGEGVLRGAAGEEDRVQAGVHRAQDGGARHGAWGAGR